MLNISFEQFNGFFRGVIRQGNVYRYTRKKFADGAAAELYVLGMMMRYRTMRPAERGWDV